MSKTHDAAVEIQARALAEALRGGVVKVLSSEKVLVRCSFPENYEIVDGTTLVFKDLPSAIVEAMGAPVAFEAATKSGAVLISGTVGKKRTPGSLEKKDMVLEDHENLYAGMKFSLGEFRHRIKII